MPSKPNHAAQDQAEYRRSLVLKMRLVRGLTLHRIAEELAAEGIDVSLQTISRDIHSILAEVKELEPQEAEQLRLQEVAALDAIKENMMQQAADPKNIRASDAGRTAVQAIAEKAKILNLYAPTDLKDPNKLSFADLLRIRRAGQKHKQADG